MKLCPRCSESFADDAGFCPFDGSELARNADPLVGRTLAARYRLVRPLGSGGMALVYLARHVMIDRMSAIKVLRRDLGMSASHRERSSRRSGAGASRGPGRRASRPRSPRRSRGRTSSGSSIATSSPRTSS
jgi:serine/threonine-protein kinase